MNPLSSTGLRPARYTALLCAIWLSAFVPGLFAEVEPITLTDKLQVIARACFARCWPDEPGVQIIFEYKPVGGKRLPSSYTCRYEEMTYLITTPDGQTHRLTPAATPATRGAGLPDRINVLFYEAVSRHILTEGSGFSREKLDYGWKQTELPDLTKAGAYRLVVTGTFRSEAPGAAPLPFESSAAEWTVDPKAMSMKALKTRAQELVEKRVEKKLPPLDWRIEASEAKRASEPVLSAVVRPQFLPEDQIPSEGYYSNLGSFGGKRYHFTFSHDGKLITEKTELDIVYQP